MSSDELVDIGRLIAAVTQLQDRVVQLQDTVMQLQSQVINMQKTNQDLANEVLRLRHELKILTSPGDTVPDCPALVADPPSSHRIQLRSVSEEEPDSALMRQMEVRATKSGIEARGPSGMVVVWSLVLGLIGTGLLTLWHKLGH
jgi:TolA-binding protein